MRKDADTSIKIAKHHHASWCGEIDCHQEHSVYCPISLWMSSPLYTPTPLHPLHTHNSTQHTQGNKLSILMVLERLRPRICVYFLIFKTCFFLSPFFFSSSVCDGKLANRGFGGFESRGYYYFYLFYPIPLFNRCHSYKVI